MKNNSLEDLKRFHELKKSYLKHEIIPFLKEYKDKIGYSEIKIQGDDEILMELKDGRILLFSDIEMDKVLNGKFSSTMMVSENGEDVGILFIMLPEIENKDDYYFFLMVGDTEMSYHNIDNLKDVKDVPEYVSQYFKNYNEFKKGGQVDSNYRKNKISKVMREFKKGLLHSSSGELVTDRKQAIAIAISEADSVHPKLENGGHIVVGEDVRVKGRYYSGVVKSVKGNIILVEYPNLMGFKESVDASKIELL